MKTLLALLLLIPILSKFVILFGKLIFDGINILQSKN